MVRVIQEPIMTNGKNGGTMTSWLASIIAALILIGGMATAYSDLNSKVLENTVLSRLSSEDIKYLDRYGVHLSGEINKLKGDAIRTDSEMGGLQRTTDRLEFTMKEILKEMKRMNENLIRMGAKNVE